MIDMSLIKAQDPEIYEALSLELGRQRDNIELIASENFVSPAVMAAAGSFLTNKYAEGYPGKRYYGGCQFVDIAENLARDRAKQLFGCDHVNVQPHSGANANLAVYFAVCKPGDTILGMNLSHGGHLSHGSPVNISGKYFNIVPYGVSKETETIDYDELERLAVEHKPRLIVAGASAYARTLDFARFREIADKVGALLMVDIAHIAGLVAAGDHPSPFGLADIITTTTHKTLRGPRGGMIFCKPELAKKVDSAVFPGTQGGPLEHVIAGKAVAAEEACTDEYREYIHAVVRNCRAMCEEFRKMGYDVVTGGTDNHLFLLDLTKTGLTGKAVQDELDRHGITLNKNCVPNETRSPQQTSGVRIGTAAMTTKGYTEADFLAAAHRIDEVLRAMQAKTM